MQGYQGYHCIVFNYKCLTTNIKPSLTLHTSPTLALNVANVWQGSPATLNARLVLALTYLGVNRDQQHILSTIPSERPTHGYPNLHQRLSLHGSDMYRLQGPDMGMETITSFLYTLSPFFPLGQQSCKTALKGTTPHCV